MTEPKASVAPSPAGNFLVRQFEEAADPNRGRNDAQADNVPCVRCRWPQVNHPITEHREGDIVHVLHHIVCDVHEGWTPPSRERDRNADAREHLAVGRDRDGSGDQSGGVVAGATDDVVPTVDRPASPALVAAPNAGAASDAAHERDIARAFDDVALAARMLLMVARDDTSGLDETEARCVTDLKKSVDALDAWRRAPTKVASPRPGTAVRSLDEWHEDHGPVLWWRFPIVEPPYAGTPLDDDFPDYVTHWTRFETPEDRP